MPGPGQYDPAIELVREKGPNYRVGTESRNRTDPEATQKPGPGQYDINREMRGKKYRFGTSIRTNKRLSEAPGPGYYKLPKVTGHMANYYPANKKIPSAD